jgi:putative peptidoglycan lipid II flippase
VAEPVHKTGRAAAIVGVAVMCSRVLGLAREVIFNALFGSKVLEMFLTAFRIPNLLRDLFAEGALSTAFVTVFTQKSTTDGDAAAWKLANRIGSLTFVGMSVITIVGMAFSPMLIDVLAGGFEGEKAVITAKLTTVMFPFILMVSLGAQVMGMLNSKHVFGWPAMASSFFNIGSVIGGVGIAYMIDPEFGPRGLMGLAIGTLIGGFLQLIVQLPSLWKVGYRLKLDLNWRDPGVLEVLKIMGPAVMAAGAVQINVMVNTSFATYCEAGSVTWLTNAFRLMQLPLGIFGVAVGTVTLPLLARSIALGQQDEFVSGLARGMRLVFFLTVPASVGLWMLAAPILAVIYQRGKVTPYDIEQAAGALRYYSVGLAAYAGIKVLAPAFYALGKRKTPMMVSFFSVALNFTLNSTFINLGWGHKGLALSTGIVALTNFGLLYWLMRRETKLLETNKLLVTLFKVFLATDAMALVCWVGNLTMLSNWRTMGFFLRSFSLGITIALATAAFVGVAALLRVREMRDVLEVARRKLSRRS